MKYTDKHNALVSTLCCMFRFISTMEHSVVWHESVVFDGTLSVYFSYSKHSGMKMNENCHPITAYLV